MEELKFDAGELKDIDIAVINNNTMIIYHGQLFIYSDSGDRKFIKDSRISSNNLSRIITNDSSIMLLDTDNRLFGWGSNYHGQLGLGPTKFRNFQSIGLTVKIGKIVQFAFGGGHTVLLDNDGRVFVSGNNENGQLGLGTTHDQHNFKRVRLSQTMGKIVQIACGYDYTILLDHNGKVFVCGNNEYGQIGLGEDVTMTTTFQIVKDVSNIVQIACSSLSLHTMLLDCNGSVLVSGYNKDGRLGLGDDEDRYTFEYVKDLPKIIKTFCLNISVVLDVDNNLLACGNNEYGQLNQLPRIIRKSNTFIKMNLPFDINQSIRITSGYFTNIAFVNDNKVYSNIRFSLGMSTTIYMELPLPKITEQYITNPQTGRLIQVGGRTYQR